MASPPSPPQDAPQQITLFTYFRSSCSARLRIALNYKSLPYTPVYINIKDGAHLDASYAALNPSRTVPVLVVPHPAAPSTIITQSLAALDYLEEAYPAAAPLLPPPSDLAGRAVVRTLAHIIALDTQPPTNMRVLKRFGADAPLYARDVMAASLAAYEAAAAPVSGFYSYGNAVTIADVCLVPAVWNAERYGVDLTPFPTVRKIVEHTRLHVAFRRAYWRHQEDCPDEFKEVLRAA